MMTLIILNQQVLDPVAIELGPFSIRWYAIIIVIAIIVADWMIRREGVRKGYDPETLFDLLFPAIIIGGVGARLYYVIFRWDYYRQHLDEIIAIWQGGIAIYGFIIGAVLTLIYLCRRRHLNVIEILDMMAPALLLAQAIGRWANFINQEAYGTAIARDQLSPYLPNWLIEQMYIQGNYHHPTFLYESAWSLVGVVALVFLRQKPNTLLEGEIIGLYGLWYALGRVWIEGLRTDSLYLGPLRVSQWLSVIIIIASIIWIIYRRKNRSETPYYTEHRQGGWL